MSFVRMILGLTVLLPQFNSLWAEDTFPGAGVSVAAIQEAGEISAVLMRVVEHVNKQPDGRMPYTLDADAWSKDYRNLPIGVFDSGIGGLTVQEAILALDSFNNDNYSPEPDGRRDFENERFIYFGDQANMPYGNYPSAGRQDFLQELILKDAVFLLGRRYWPDSATDRPKFDKRPVKAIVIACNTATAWGLEEIRQAIHAWKIPVIVIGVVEAGARGVMEDIDSAEPPRTVAVLATVGTCGSNAYPKAIGHMTGLAGKRIPDVVQQGSVGLAGAIESDPAFVNSDSQGDSAARVYLGPSTSNRNAVLDTDAIKIYGFDPTGLVGDENVPESLRLNSVENYVRYDVTTLVRNHKAAGKTTAIDTVVLGCTHFPLVKQEILSAFADLRACEFEGKRPYESLIAESVTVVDPAEMTARELFREMARRKLFRGSLAGTDRSKDRYFISVPNPKCATAIKTPDGSLDHDYKYSRQPGQLTIEDTICVPMEISRLPASSTNLIRSRLPEVWSRLGVAP